MPRQAAADYAILLRGMADQLPAELATLAPDMRAMADAFERAINNTNNAAASVIGLVELGLGDQIAALRADLDGRYAESQADRRELHSAIDELRQVTEQILGLLKDAPAEAADGDR